MALSNPKFDANIVRQILAITGGDKQKLIEMFNDPKQKHLQPAILMADMQSQALKRDAEIKQGQGQGQHPTVAAALGLAPSSAPPTPPAAPAGLGATPQGMQMASAAPMPPQGGMPPVGMAAGGMTELPDSYGLESLPIPDNMYNEESFAGGGIVAFAKGDSVDAELIELMNEVRKGGPRALVAQQRIRELQQKGTGIASELSSRSPQRLADLGVSRGEGGIHDNLLSHIRPLSLEGGASDEQMRPGRVTPGAGTRTPDENAQALKDYMTNAASLFGGNVGGASGAEYTPVVDNQRAAGINALMASSATTPTPTRTPVRTPAPRGERGVVGGATRTPAGATAPAAGTTPEMSDEDIAEKRMQGFLDAAKPPAPKGTTDEEKAARKNEDLWSALAQIGFGMAAGESPNFLTNVGKATAAAVPGMQESLKERRADTKEELKQQYAYELAQAGFKGDAYKLKLNQFDRLEDNRYRKETLAEQIRGNRRREELQEQQIAASYKPTGTENLVKLIAAGKAPGATDEQKRLADAAEYALKGYAGAVGGAEIANKARDNVDSAISKNINLSRTLNDLAKKDRANAKTGNPTTLYEDKYNEMIDAEQKRLGRGLLGKQTPEDPLGLL